MLMKRYVFFVLFAFTMGIGSAQAQGWGRDAVVGFYGALGGIGGGAMTRTPGGAVAGATGGGAVGGWVYDTHRQFYTQPAPRTYRYYAPPQYRYYQSTPYMIQRRY